MAGPMGLIIALTACCLAIPQMPMYWSRRLRTKSLKKRLVEALYEQSTSHGQSLFDRSSLEAIAKAAGVSDALIQWAWSSVELREEMEEDEHIAAQLGSGVPLFVFDNAFSLSGAQPEAAFLEALNKMQEKSKVEDDAFSSQVCGIDGCKI